MALSSAVSAVAVVPPLAVAPGYGAPVESLILIDILADIFVAIEAESVSYGLLKV